VLEVIGLRKTFGSLTVIDNVSVSVSAGEALGIMGPNGAGKSTFFDLLTGVTSADGGQVILDGTDVSGMSVEARVRAGIARAFQIPKQFGSLTVEEHLRLAAIAGAGVSVKDAKTIAEDLLQKTRLKELAETMGNKLLLLDRKRLEFAKALATKPRVILLDEISGGLTDNEVKALIEMVQSLKSPDLAIIWIEHIAYALSATCDRIMMLSLGKKVIDDVPEVVTSNPQVRSLYLGENHIA
jgi:branched-chain amino acid transport system ATP-binding protein